MTISSFESILKELHSITSSVQESIFDQFKRIVQGKSKNSDEEEYPKQTHEFLAKLFSKLQQEIVPSSEKKIEREIVFRASMTYLSKQICLKLSIYQSPLPKTDYDYLVPSQKVQTDVTRFFDKCKLDTLNHDQLGVIYQEVLKGCDQQHSLGAFYTPKKTVQYMTSKLDLVKGSIVFDPACGNGNFLEECINQIKKKNLEAGDNPVKACQKAISQVCGNDIDPYAVLLSIIRIMSLSAESQFLKKVNILNCDTLVLKNWNQYPQLKKINRIIGNPPYGISPSIERKKLYKRIYRDKSSVYGYKLGGNDLFGFFLANAIKNVENGGKICFIGTDTFLSLRSYTVLRRLILDTCKIDEISLAPIDLFRPITTSRTCIITLTKELCEKGYDHNSIPDKRHCSCSSCVRRRKNQIRLVDRLSNQSEYLSPPENKVQIVEQLEYDYIKGYPFWINIPNKFIDIMKLVNQLPPNNIKGDWKFEELRNYIDGGEGISTGNNPSHLVIIKNSRLWRELANKKSKKLERYRILNKNQILNLSTCDEDTLDDYRYNGIQGEKYLIPFERGSYIPFWGSEGWYIDWSTDSVNKIKKRAKDTKGRQAVFRNPHLYFQSGIVTTAHHGILKATYTKYSIPAGNTNLIFGLDIETQFLLGYLNSNLASYFLGKIINTTLGGMSGHVTPENIKRLPFLFPTMKKSKNFNELKQKVIQITRKIISLLQKDLNIDYSEEKSQLDDLIYEWFNLRETDSKVIDSYLNQVRKEKVLY